MRWIYVFIATWFISLAGYAQKYSTAAGLRVDGDQLGITMKQRVFRSFALEGMLTGNDREMRGTLLLENHYPLIGKGLNFYVGGGGHLGGLDDFGPVMGVDAIMGAELKIPLLRLVVSADVKPAYHISHEENFDYSTAISVRYVLGKEGKNQRQKARAQRKRKRERLKTRSDKVKEREKQKQAKLKEKHKTKRAKYKEKTKRLKEKNKAKRKKKDDQKTFRDWKVFKIFKKDS
uniref:Outer membrane protein beta-barrel domain-containing protein n=1 Tax=Roseihalotalea indica TaxID=2867963 RepID=A0AA49GHS3_9BACT|nr:hypothetical protein K4G66_16995 [Tunicatimonas sp. TK19036]